MTPTDINPPEDHEKPVIRVPLSVTILAGVGSMLATAGVTWGVYSQRIVALEAYVNEARPIGQAQTVQLAVIQTQYVEINRQLADIRNQIKASK